VTLVETLLAARFLRRKPQRLIGDKAYDSDRLDLRLRRRQGIELIAPNIRQRGRRGPRQDGRSLRRYRRRWKIERLFAWLFNFRRVIVRYDYHVENYLGFVLLGCAIILLRTILR
jgi:transposase